MEGELDLGHLTEVEQTIILNVLLRDADLRSKEEGRVRLVCLQYLTYLTNIYEEFPKRNKSVF